MYDAKALGGKEKKKEKKIHTLEMQIVAMATSISYHTTTTVTENWTETFRGQLTSENSIMNQ